MTTGRSLDAQPLYGEELGAGAMVGDYLVDGPCGGGGFASVYRARAGDGRTVALKVLRRQFLTSPQLLQRFQREADALARLRHPHIVEIFEQGELSDGRPFIAMAWIEGQDLAAFLAAQGPRSASEALALVEPIASALAAAHAIGVIHRDLKAQNVLVTPRGDGLHVTLLDFGIAKLLVDDNTPGLTSTGMVLGTPAAMAPEQIRGQPVDERTDVYALGVLIYQLVTGRLPFRGASSVETEELHLHAPAPRASDLAPLSRAFDAVIARCLEKRPGDRFPSVAAVAEALRDAVDPARSAAPEGTPPELRITLRIDPSVDDPDDGLLDDLDAALALARAACLEAGLTIAVAAGDLLVAQPAREADDPAHLQRVARALAARLDARPSRRPELTVAVVVVAATRAGDGAG